ncbi:sialate O-acetylesterase [Acinetobacter sp. TSRC1-2]|uniref:sialate O-acetylesterase n=1 Tax=unclassified Acinetobacter TaxID=196816 RepID=UPI003CEEBE72
MPLPNILEFIGTNISQRKFQEAQEKLLNYLGIEVPTRTEFDSVISNVNDAIAPKADKNYVDNIVSAAANGVIPFQTQAELLLAKPTQLKVLAKAMDTRKEYLWNRTSAEGVIPVTGAWMDTGLGDLDQSKDYTNQQISVKSIYESFSAYVEVQLDPNGNSRVKLYSDSTKNLIFDTRIEQSVLEINDLKSKTEGIAIYETVKGFVTVFLDSDGISRIKEISVDGILKSFMSIDQKSLIAGTGIAIIESPGSITIEASDIVYETPHEFVLCLIAGQSNASYYGGDSSLAPAIPEGVCYIWDNTYNIVREINDGSLASDVCKQTYGPALALEFYKRTGLGLIIVNSAVGSTAQTAEADNGAGNWSPTGTLRQTAVDRIVACRAYLDSISTCFQNGFIVWTQGERDGQEIQINTITKLQYKNGLSEMVDFFKTNLGSKLPFIITTTAYYATTGDNAGSKSVRAAQSEIAHEKAGVFLGFTGAVKFFERNLMDDNVHYNQIGKNILGTALGKISSKLSAGVN